MGSDMGAYSGDPKLVGNINVATIIIEIPGIPAVALLDTSTCTEYCVFFRIVL